MLCVNYIQMEIGTLLRVELAKRNWSGKKLSEVSGIYPSLISQYLNGRHEPNMETRRKLAIALDLSPDYFEQDSEEKVVREDEVFYQKRRPLLDFSELERELLDMARSIVDLKEEVIELRKEVTECRSAHGAKLVNSN